jgi:hypothetical protein
MSERITVTFLDNPENLEVVDGADVLEESFVALDVHLFKAWCKLWIASNTTREDRAAILQDIIDRVECYEREQARLNERPTGDHD